MAPVIREQSEDCAGSRRPSAPRACFAAHPLVEAFLAVALSVASACGGSQSSQYPTRAAAPPTPTAAAATPHPSPLAPSVEPTLAPFATPTARPSPQPAASPTAPALPAPAEPPAPPQALTIVAEGAAFHPSDLTAPAGAITVTLDNRDAGVRHDLQLYGPSNTPAGSTAVIVGPAVASLTLDAAPGSYRFVCTVHPLQMRGVLIVE